MLLVSISFFTGAWGAIEFLSDPSYLPALVFTISGVVGIGGIKFIYFGGN
jgi:carbamoylphosphate synthase small subunit